MLLCLQTYDGERILYAALTDDIRRLLLDEGFQRQGEVPFQLCTPPPPRMHVYTDSPLFSCPLHSVSLALPLTPFL